MGPPTPEAARPTVRPHAPLAIERIAVGAARVEALVRVADASLVRTSAVPGLAEELLALLPGLRRHRCECGSARGIVSELSDTEVPHALEHVALELAALAGSPRTLGGQTRWDFATDGRGMFRVSLDYDHDLVVLAALKEAAALLNMLLTRGGGPDRAAGETAIDEAVERIRRARDGGAAVGPGT